MDGIGDTSSGLIVFGVNDFTIRKNTMALDVLLAFHLHLLNIKLRL